MERVWLPFWEKAYQDETITAFSAEPNVTLKEFEHLFRKEWKIIDIGCG